MISLLEYFRESISYSEYQKLFKAEAAIEDDSKMRGFIKLNWTRHQRNEKSKEIKKSFGSGMPNKVRAMIITEPWCGDAAQSVPILYRICEHLNIECQIALRDAHEGLIEQFLTDGGKAIPKLVVFNAESSDVHFVWGPRPKPAQAMITEFKADDSMTYDEFSISLQKWYNQDKTETIQDEVHKLFTDCFKLSN